MFSRYPHLERGSKDEQLFYEDLLLKSFLNYPADVDKFEFPVNFDDIPAAKAIDPIILDWLPWRTTLEQSSPLCSELESVLASAYYASHTVAMHCILGVSPSALVFGRNRLHVQAPAEHLLQCDVGVCQIGMAGPNVDARAKENGSR
jgi:hypothetical protein